eukprot:2058549-Rhodomonas_salina.3
MCIRDRRKGGEGGLTVAVTSTSAPGSSIRYVNTGRGLRSGVLRTLPARGRRESAEREREQSGCEGSDAESHNVKRHTETRQNVKRQNESA